MIKIGILSSYNGSGFVAINDACKSGHLDASVEVVISNNTDANVLKIAKGEGIKNYCINSKLYPKENIDLKILEIFQKYSCDYIFLSGYMKKVDNSLLDYYKDRIINAHPALLPKFGGKGMYGRFVHEAVHKSKAEKTGVTIHFVNEKYDDGAYILQKEMDILPNETVDSIENRVKALETITIVETFKKLIK